MKNFPHQINQLPRLMDALSVFATLIDAQRDVDDDGLVGDALARAEVYTFRAIRGRTISQLLQAEHAKPPDKRGTETCARELRRFFGLLGFIRHTEGGGWEVSASATSLLALDLKDQIDAANDIWRQALLAMQLTDATGSSHPYQVLLRLLAAMPGLAKPYAGLCLAARDDSDSEFARIRRIAAKPNPAQTMVALAGENQAKNSIKILPSIAKQLGDIQERAGLLFVGEQVADVLTTDDESIPSEEAVQKLVRRPYAPRRRDPGGPRRAQGTGGRVTHFFDPDAVGARFNAHEDCLDSLSRLFPPEVERLQAVYDLLLVISGKVMLVEAKTIRSDARRQVRIALGQLFYYEHFDVAPLYPDKEMLRLVLTDQEMGLDLQGFLTKHRTGVVWIPEEGTPGASELGIAHLQSFGAAF